MTIKVRADELLHLTVDDIGDEEFFELADPENETEEHIAHLRWELTTCCRIGPALTTSSVQKTMRKGSVAGGGRR